jgi:site-specific recombinase XerD
MSNKPESKLEDKLRGVLRLKQYSPRTEEPYILTQEEVKTLLAGVKGDTGLAVKLFYGCGLRVAEVLPLRVKDVDVSGGKIEVRGGKGDKDRVITLPKCLLHPIG